jgi:hypothetical protein
MELIRELPRLLDIGFVSTEDDVVNSVELDDDGQTLRVVEFSNGNRLIRVTPMDYSNARFVPKGLIAAVGKFDPEETS